MVITIGREFGSGGRELGKKLADALNIAYYDKEILVEITKNIDASENYVENILNNGIPPTFYLNFAHTFTAASYTYNSTAMNVLAEQRNAIKRLAQKDCVIVGRSADIVLQDIKPFKIFVYADEKSKLERCKKRAEEEENFSDKVMLKKMRNIDKGRIRFHSIYSDVKWGDKRGYDLMVNTTGIEIDDVIPSVAEYVKKYFKI